VLRRAHFERNRPLRLEVTGGWSPAGFNGPPVGVDTRHREVAEWRSGAGDFGGGNSIMGKRQRGHLGEKGGKPEGQEHTKRGSVDSSSDFSDSTRPTKPKNERVWISDTVNPPSPPDKKKGGDE